MPQPRRRRGGGNISTTASSGGMDLRVHVTVEGVEKTDDAFKRIRRDVNQRMRDVMSEVGEREALPAVRAVFPSRTFADTLYVKRDRSGVFLGSRARGPLNRAVGWLDFGGLRPRDSVRRQGPYTIVRTLNRLRPQVDAAVLEGLMREFSRDFEVS